MTAINSPQVPDCFIALAFRSLRREASGLLYPESLWCLGKGSPRPLTDPLDEDGKCSFSTKTLPESALKSVLSADRARVYLRLPESTLQVARPSYCPDGLGSRKVRQNQSKPRQAFEHPALPAQRGQC